MGMTQAQMEAKLKQIESLAKKRQPLILGGGSQAGGSTSVLLLKSYLTDQSVSSANTWTSLVTDAVEAEVYGSGLTLSTSGIRVERSGIYRLSAVCYAEGTSSADGFLGILINGTALNERVRIDPAPTLFSSATNYDGSHISTIKTLSGGDVVSAGVNLQNGTIPVKGAKSFVLVEKIVLLGSSSSSSGGGTPGEETAPD